MIAITALRNNIGISYRSRNRSAKAQSKDITLDKDQKAEKLVFEVNEDHKNMY